MAEEVQRPSMGRIVHFVESFRPGMGAEEDAQAIQLPAIILSVVQASNEAGQPVDTFDVTLQIFGRDFNGRGEIVKSSFDPKGKRPGSWHYPERV